MPEAAFADVDAGRILLRTPFSNLLLCKRIPGASWDKPRRVWTYPATPKHARLIRSSIPQLETSERFTALLTQMTGAPSTPPPPAPKPEPQPAVTLPAGLKTKPWRHQIEAFQFAMECLLRGAGAALLALLMGLGKTLVALMVMAALAARRVLISCPLRVVPVWEQQIERHLDLPLIVVTLDDSAGSVANKKKLAEEKLKLAEVTGRPLVIIINYDSVWRSPFADWAEAQQWDLIIADESHRLKAPGGKASLAFKRLRSHARYRLALTGTPLPHSPLDAYAQFRFLNHTIFGPSFAAFRQKYAVMGGFQRKQVTGFQQLDELEALMKTITFRVSKDVLDLPPETHVTYECELSTEALRVYRDLEEDFVAEVRDGRVTAANAMVKLLRLQQVAGGWVKTDDGQYHRVDSAKQNLLADTLEDIGAGEPVVVFCRFHADLDAVHEATKTAGFESLELSGRRDELKRWQSGDAQVLAVQISAGGVGMWDSAVRDALHQAARAEGCDFRGLGLHCFRRANITWRQEVGGSAIEASKIAGHTTLAMTSQYTFVAPERQNELTRRIQQKLADAGKKPEEQQAAPEIPPPATPPAPEVPPSLADTVPVTAVVQ